MALYNLFKIHIVTLCIFIVHDIKLEMAISFRICCWDDARCQVAISEQDQLNILDSSQFTRKKVQHLYSCKFTAKLDNCQLTVYITPRKNTAVMILRNCLVFSLNQNTTWQLSIYLLKGKKTWWISVKGKKISF